MTLKGAKQILNENNIPFSETFYESEASFLIDTFHFACTKRAKTCKVIALIIYSNNGKKNLRLQFNKTDDEFLFEDLFFGGFNYEMFDYNEEMLPNDLIKEIKDAMSGKLHIIEAYDLKKKKWFFDGAYLESDDESINQIEEFNKTVQRIEKEKSFIKKLFKTKNQYEIFDWNSYRTVIK